MIQWITDRLRQCDEVNDIVIATCAEAENEPLREYASKQNLGCFWYSGGVDLVTTRLRRAAEAFGADICILVSGDCPLIHAPLIDMMIRRLREAPDADYVEILPDESGQRPAIEGINVARRRAWQLADDLSSTPEMKEHQFPIIRAKPDLFRATSIRLDRRFYMPSIRLSVDTIADLEFMNRTHNLLRDSGRPFDLPGVLALIRADPALCEINAHVHQRGLSEAVRSVLFFADAGGGYGYGHFMRSLEVARQTVERLGWPVTFAVDDDRAVDLAGREGFRTVWDAFGRPARGPRSGTSCQGALEPDVVVADIAPRPVQQDWRKRFNAPLLAIDSDGAWTREADLVIFPGVTHPDNVASSPDAFPPPRLGAPPRLGGLHYLILRREVMRVSPPTEGKDLDLLVYLHRDEPRQIVTRFASENGLRAHIIRGFADDFPSLLARSRVFLSGFGYGFYEALAAGAYPAAWPHSPAHHRQALQFYERTGLSPAVVEGEKDLGPQLQTALAGLPRDLTVEDGTPNVVTEIKRLAIGGPNTRREPTCG